MLRTCIENPVKVTMFFAGLVLLGWLSYRRLPLNLFPDVRTPRITVVVTTDGLPPQQAERLLTMDIERQMASIKGIASVTSYSRDRNIVLHVDFHWGQDMEFAYLDVKKNISQFETNEHVEQIDVYRFDPNAAPLLTLAFVPPAGGRIERVALTSFVENSLKPRLETIEGVAYVKTAGDREEEVFVEVNEELMSQYQLTSAQILQAIEQSNLATPAGVVVENNREMLLKFINRLSGLDEIGQVIVKTVNDYPVRLIDIARLSTRPVRDEVLVRQDLAESIALRIYREPEANAVLTARRVREAVDELNRRGGYGLKIATDLSRDIESAIAEVVDTALVGMGLAMLVLLVFLRNLRATLAVGFAIPLSILGTFSLMYFQHLSLNIMTLGGLALGAGMLVDNGIVVIENVFRHRQAGAEAKTAALEGTREVAMAITASTLTTIVVFVPLVYVHGIAGLLFKDQALTVVYSLLVSLLVALGLLPMLAARLGRQQPRPPGRLDRVYGGFLAGSLRWRWLLLLAFASGLYWTWLAGRTIPREFFPKAVVGRFSAAITLPPGSTLEQTAADVARLERALEAFRYRDPRLAPLLRAWERYERDGLAGPLIAAADSWHEQVAPPPDLPAELRAQLAADQPPTIDVFLAHRDWLDEQIILRSVTTIIGSDPTGVEAAREKILGPHTATIDVTMNPGVLRELAAEDLIERLRAEAALHPEMEISFEAKSEFLQELLGRERGDIVLEVHADRLEHLMTSAERVAQALRTIPGLVNVRTNLTLGEEEFVLTPDRDALLRDGFTVEGLATQIQAYLQGNQSERLRFDEGDMIVTVSPGRAEEAGLRGLLDLPILPGDGQAGSLGGANAGERQKLRNLVSVGTTRSLRELMRVNQEKTLLVMADREGVRYQDAIAAIGQALAAVPWPLGATWNLSGEEVQRRESFDRLFFALMIAIVLVYMVIAAILESIIHPLTIMLSVPFALAGVVAAFILTGVSLNLMGYIGIVMLVGIVVNNAIVLLDRVNQLRMEGATARQALIDAGRQRLRPILMTSLTTILALVPLALGYGEGAELRRPMAIAVIGGLGASTLLTLWLMPGIYLCVEDIRSVFRRGRGLFARRAVEPEPEARGS